MKKKILALISLFMVTAMLLPYLTACGKHRNNDDDNNDDNNKENEYMSGHNEILELTYTEDITSIISSGDETAYQNMRLTPSFRVYADGSSCSARWSPDSTTQAVISTKSEDITNYDAIQLKIFNPETSDSTSVLQLCIYCQISPTDGNPNRRAYKRCSLKIDWTGWKTVTLNLDEFSDGYGADLSQVTSVVLNSVGWDSLGTKLYNDIYIDSVSYVNVTYTPSISNIGDYNYDHVKETLVSMITGGMSLEGASASYASKLEEYVRAAKTVQAKLRRSTEAPFDYDMTTTAGITSNYYDIRRMARGYAVEGGELYHNEELLNDIVYAMNQMHENYYKDRSMRQYPTRNNWWDWEIGSAQSIVDIIMLIEDDVPEQYINKWLEPVNKYVPLPSMTMANRVDLAYVTIAASAIQKDPIRMVRSVKALDECCIYVESGDGFYTDGSYIQHDTIAYTGSYGPIMLEALSKLVMANSDTCFRFGDAMIEHQYNWAIDSFTPLMFHGAFFGSVRGRSICRSATDVSHGLTAVIGMLRMTKYVSDNTKCNKLKSIIKEYAAYNGAYYESALAPDTLKLLNSVLSDDSVRERTDFTFAKIFARMDRPIAQLEKYGVSISLSSSRIAKYEAINEENRDGWYTGDGMLYVYTTVNDYDPEFWHNVNKYRLPGTTVTTAKRDSVLNINQNDTLSKYNFVGGTALENSLVAAMQFESSTSKMESATDNTKFSSTLNGKKGWFVFDNEIVCLGAGISCSDNYDSLTVIENRRIGNGVFKADGETLTGSGTITDKHALYIEGFGGIYLPENDTVNYNHTSGDVKFLELYFDHGKNFKNETYSYVLLPVMSEEETRSYAETPGITILSNTDSVMAVRDESSKTTGYIFWKAGTFNGVTVDKPCTVMISENEISCADPTQTLTKVTVTVNGNAYVFDNIKNGATEVLSLK